MSGERAAAVEERVAAAEAQRGEAAAPHAAAAAAAASRALARLREEAPPWRWHLLNEIEGLMMN
jgi:hypothetical protein